MTIISFDSLPSTNQYCELLDLARYEEFTIISAKSQTAGIGQRGNHWSSQANENLTFSIILKPTAIPIACQFQLTKSISLGITDWLKELLPNTDSIHIKWPNDIYVDLNKICGTLISTKINAHGISAAIVGIGMNINQTVFPDWVPNPTSLKLITGDTYDLQTTLERMAEKINIRYQQLLENISAPDEEYLSQLLFIGEQRNYIVHGRPVSATINGVNPFGHLNLTTPQGDSLTCQMKEIQYIL